MAAGVLCYSSITLNTATYIHIVHITYNTYPAGKVTVVRLLVWKTLIPIDPTVLTLTLNRKKATQKAAFIKGAFSKGCLFATLEITKKKTPFYHIEKVDKFISKC